MSRITLGLVAFLAACAAQQDTEWTKQGLIPCRNCENLQVDIHICRVWGLDKNRPSRVDANAFHNCMVAMGWRHEDDPPRDAVAAR